MWAWLRFWTWRPKPPKPPAPPAVRTVAVIVRDTAGANVDHARVELDDVPRSHVGFTVDGMVTFADVPVVLAASHLWVSAIDYEPVSVHLDLPSTDVQVWCGGEPDQATAIRLPALEPVKLVADHDPRKVKCNFGSLWDPVLARWIFQGNYPSMDEGTRARWREIAAAAGDTHFQCGNPTTPYEDYHIPAYTNWLLIDDMAWWVACAKELQDDGFTVIAYADSGDNYPGVGYHKRFFDAIPAEMKPNMIGVPGHEIVPGGYSTKNANDAILEISAAGMTLIAMHTGDDRLSWSSNPVEQDDPFHGDELACWHGEAGHKITHHFCQLRTSRADDPLVDTVTSSVACEAHGISSRADGSGWVDPNGNPCPNWGMSWIEPVLWETDEELVFKGERTREQILAVVRACLAHGFSGHGCGTPDMLT